MLNAKFLLFHVQFLIAFAETNTKKQTVQVYKIACTACNILKICLYFIVLLFLVRCQRCLKYFYAGFFLFCGQYLLIAGGCHAHAQKLFMQLNGLVCGNFCNT